MRKRAPLSEFFAFLVASFALKSNVLGEINPLPGKAPTQKNARFAQRILDRCFALACFGLTASALFFLGQLFVYRYTPYDVPIAVIALVAAVGGLLGVMAGRFERRTVGMETPGRMIVVLGPLVAVLAAFLLLTPNLWEYSFPLRSGAVIPVFGWRAAACHIGLFSSVLLPSSAFVLLVLGVVNDMAAATRFLRKPSKSTASRPPISDNFRMLSKEESIAFAIAVFVQAALRLPWFSPGEINCDEYYHHTFYGEPGGFGAVMIAQSRFTYYFVYWLFEAFLHISPLESQLVCCWVGIFGILSGGLLLARLWGISSSTVGTTFLLLVLSLHPYVQDYFFFRYGLLIWLGFPLAVSPLIAVRPNVGSVFLQGLVLALCLGFYQTFLNATISAFLLLLVLEGVRQLTLRRRPSFVRLWAHCRVTERLAVILSGCFLYTVIAFLFRRVMPTTFGNYAKLLDVSDLSTVFSHGVTLMERYWHLFSITRPSFGIPLNFIPVFLAMTAVAAVLFRCVSGVSGSRRRARMFFSFLLLSFFFFASFVAPFGVMSFVVWGSYPPRGVMFLAVFWSGVFTLVWFLFEKTPIFRRSLIAAAGILVVAYSLFLSQLTYDIFRLAQYDRALAQRLVADLERLPNFRDVRRVYIAPRNFTPDYQWSLAGVRNGFFASAYFWPHSAVNILNGVSGYRFEMVPGYDRVHLSPQWNLDAKAAGQPVWPEPGSIVVEGDIAIVRLK